MVDLTVLYRRLDIASFSERAKIAEEVVRDMTAEELGPLVRGLEHPHQTVRLGVIEILRRAGYREGLRKLLAHAEAFDGDDRVYAIRAMAQLAEPGDSWLAEPVKRWLASKDEFVVAQATKLATTLAVPRPAGAEPSTPTPAAAASLDRLVVNLFSAVKGSERIAIVEAIEQRGPQALGAVAKLAFAKGNADVIAYVCRAVIRQAAVLPSPRTLVPLLEAARRRLGYAPIADAAIDDALLALGGVTLSPTLLARLGSMDRAQIDAVVQRLAESPAAEVALHVPTMLDALARNVTLWTALGPAIAHAAAHLRDSTRTELRAQTEVVLDELRKGKLLPPVAIVSVCWVLARIAEPGEPLPRHLRIAVDRIAAVEAARALCALCVRLATEEAAVVLIGMLRDPLAEARTAAREALATWQSSWVQLEGAEPPAIVVRYVDEHGEPLVRRADRLVVAVSGEEYVLDTRGRPVRGGETELGGCLCCSPPRALVRRRGQGLRCPASWESYLRDGGRLMLEKNHAVGRCTRCDSIRPRVRDGARVICLDCGAGTSSHEGPWSPVPEGPSVPSEHHRAHDEDALPRPPTREELEHIAPHIRSAIVANVFLHARDGEDRWNGSGVIIARSGNQICILTNRHVVESDDGQRLCAMKAMTVSGEPITVRAVWRAKRGVDLALVEGTVARPDSVGVVALGRGEVLVGAEVFAIGNPLGLAWSYSAGTLSATRHWTTPEGQSVRILQTDANIAPGSSGGGMFHRDGHLIGIMSFLRQGHAGGSAHFALAIDAIREALQRDAVRWQGLTLSELP